MSSLIDVGGLLLVLIVSFIGANAMVAAFGVFVFGIDRFGEARSEGGNGGLPYAALAVLAALVCLALLVVGFLAMMGKLPIIAGG